MIFYILIEFKRIKNFFYVALITKYEFRWIFFLYMYGELIITVF